MGKKEFFIISLTIFLTVIAWLIADIYHIMKTKEVTLKGGKIIKVIDFEINQEIFKILKEKSNYE